MNLFIAFASGLVFGLGLILSGMTNPAKVQGFLDLAGAWDPSLILVMAGAIAIGLPAFRWARGRTTSLRGTSLQLPARHHIDRPLVVGVDRPARNRDIAGIALAEMQQVVEHLALQRRHATAFVAAVGVAHATAMLGFVLGDHFDDLVA